MHLRPRSFEQQNLEPRTHHRIVGSDQISIPPAPLEVNYIGPRDHTEPWYPLSVTFCISFGFG